MTMWKENDWCQQRKDLVNGTEDCREMGRLVQRIPGIVNNENELVASDGGATRRKRLPEIGMSVEDLTKGIPMYTDNESTVLNSSMGNIKL